MRKINNFALMRIVFPILFVFFMASCKSDDIVVDSIPEKNQLGITDYAEIVRHPVTLNSNIDTSLWSQIEFEQTDVRFDTVIAGTTIRKSFVFVNSGSKPLYILDTRVSCGCTVAAFSDEAIAPGETGSIDVEFNTFDKQGDQNKSIIVLSNSHPNEDRLFIRGYVKSKK